MVATNAFLQTFVHHTHTHVYYYHHHCFTMPHEENESRYLFIHLDESHAKSYPSSSRSIATDFIWKYPICYSTSMCSSSLVDIFIPPMALWMQLKTVISYPCISFSWLHPLSDLRLQVSQCRILTSLFFIFSYWISAIYISDSGYLFK